MKKTYFASLMLSAFMLTACSDETYSGDTPKDWAGTIDFYNSVDEKTNTTFFKPVDGTVGDPMPFFDPKTNDFKILYLQEYPNNDAFCFHPFFGVKTTDATHYTGMGEVLPCGKSKNEVDAALGTGSVVYDEASNLYYIYYTGHTSKEVVLRATSSDFKNWTKDLEWELHGEAFGYSAKDFRDPHVFKADDNKWHMVISSYPNDGKDPVFAEFISNDLKSWEHVGRIKMIWDRMLECPDIFKMGNFWYLVYSDKTAGVDWGRKVKYMVADSWENLKNCFNDGPKWPETMREGTLDSRSLYAAKSASNGTDRYLWGWCPTRPNGDNANVGNGKDGQAPEPNWSGALVCHKIAQNADGTIYLTAVPAMAEKYNKPAQVKVMKEEGNYTLYNRLGYHNHISFTVKLADKKDKFGVSFGRGEGNSNFVTLKFNNPHWDASWNEEKSKLARTEFFVGNGKDDKFIECAEGNFYPYADDATYNIDIYTDNSVVVVYVNGTGCMTNRIYGIQKNCWSINKYSDNIQISNVKVSQY